MAEWMNMTQGCLVPMCHPIASLGPSALLWPHWPSCDSSRSYTLGYPGALCMLVPRPGILPPSSFIVVAYSSRQCQLKCHFLKKGCVWPALPRDQILQLQAYSVLSCFALLHFARCTLLQYEGMTCHQQKDYNPLYCDTYFTAAVWNRTRSTFEACLCRCFWHSCVSPSGQCSQVQVRQFLWFLVNACFLHQTVMSMLARMLPGFAHHSTSYIVFAECFLSQWNHWLHLTTVFISFPQVFSLGEAD